MSTRGRPCGPVEVPDRLYFKIGEVAKLVGVKPYVLRYWETEFSVVRPGKTRSKHRLYRRKDVETLLEIRRLLYNERYTIEGAKRRLRRGARGAGRGGRDAGARTRGAARAPSHARRRPGTAAAHHRPAEVSSPGRGVPASRDRPSARRRYAWCGGGAGRPSWSAALARPSIRPRRGAAPSRRAAWCAARKG